VAIVGDERMLAGSGLQFDDRGIHTLKGMPDFWHLHVLAVAAAEPVPAAVA
jgi:hypothetical protein